jgi:tyrosine-protein phosphatase YwqE
MTPDENNKALDAVRKHLRSMLDKLESMEKEQEEDLKTISGEELKRTAASLEQTKKLIDEIKKSQANLESVLKGKE